MPIAALQKRLWLLSFVLIIGFALRLHNLAAADLNIDEAWSYVNSFYLAYPSGYTATQILTPEPNNSLHLLGLGLGLRFVTGAFGARFLSLIVGVLTIPVVARAAFRLYGQRAALMAALITTLAPAAVNYSQIVRPYAFATFFATLSLMFWLEKRPRLIMIAGVLALLAHVAAVSVVLTEDTITLWRVLHGRRVNKLDWIVRRIPVYTTFCLMAYMAYVRRFGSYGSGQPVPNAADVLNHALGAIGGAFPTAGTLVLLAGVLLPLALWFLWKRQLPPNLGVPLLWIATTYGTLIAAAILINGPIKWIHISHVAVALALLMSGVLAKAHRTVIATVLLAYCLASTLSLLKFYEHPDHYWSDARADVDSFRQDEERVYAQQPTVLWTLQINNPTATYIDRLPAETSRPTRYLYIEMDGWLPAAPPECDSESLWSRSDGLRLLSCRHG